ncbi:MAG: transmembrane anchor protein [Alphaproteobacteria bacterium]|nr:transmembrane anchor protein [Alphaproteobacteria bacterium]|tara:strand:+ start:1219 stop:1836 length:618 start_codon:yes stop_codon:yes gene_type:complete
MYNSNIPSDTEVPSTAKLIKSTIIAAVTAGILLVTVVMPAEYGIDPTGAGKVLGLTRMGEIKTSLAEEAAQDAAMDKQAVAEAESVSEPEIAPVPEQEVEIQTHEMSVTLAPDEGTEIKVAMKKGAKVDYVWETNGGKANFDVHGDSKELKINYHNYYKGSDQKRQGTLVAEFDGSHGWFWRNRTKEPLTITIKTNGEYSSIKRY